MYGVFLSLKVVLILANSADLIKCSIMLHFIWVFTVCQSTHLVVPSLQRVNYIQVNETLKNLKYIVASSQENMSSGSTT